MADLPKVVAEMRPMLIEFLSELGIYGRGDAFDLPELVQPFGQWITDRVAVDDDIVYLASRVLAFICEYLVEVHAATPLIHGQRILIAVPVSGGTTRHCDPYTAALAVARKQLSLAYVIANIL